MKKLNLTLLFTGIITFACSAQETIIYEETDMIDEVIEMPEEVEEPQIYMHVETMPEFPGGQGALLNYIATQTVYPDSAITKKIEDTVYIRFIVDEQGKVNTPEVVRGEHEILNEEALRVVSTLPDFLPGLQRGKPVKVQYVVPIAFKL